MSYIGNKLEFVIRYFLTPRTDIDTCLDTSKYGYFEYLYKSVRIIVMTKLKGNFIDKNISISFLFIRLNFTFFY